MFGLHLQTPHSNSSIHTQTSLTDPLTWTAILPAPLGNLPKCIPSNCSAPQHHTQFVAPIGKLTCQKANMINKLMRAAKLTWTLPSLTAGPSSASRRMNKPMLYSFPPRRLNPNPRGPLSSSTGKQPGFWESEKREMRTRRQI